MQFVWCAFVVVNCLIGIDAKWVIEGDSSIIREIQDNPSVGYLIKFHAPWCGHCKHFEPVYEEVAREVNDPALADDELQNIRIVRIDATVHSNVANYYDIRGYPTVKFIRNAQIYAYENERTKSAILNFLRRVNGPALRWLSSLEQYEALRREHEVFFLLVGETAEDDLLMKEYNDVVHRYLSQAYFYATNASTVRQRYFADQQADDAAQVFAVKNEEVFLYQPELYANSLDEFVLKEKVATFPQIAAGNIYELILTKRILVIYGFDEGKKDAEQFQRRTAVRDQLQDFVTKHSSSLHDTFQFAWSNDLELLSNIALWKIDEPLLFLYDSNERRYGVEPLLAVVDGSAELEPVLNHVVSNYSEIIQHAGNTWWKRLLRPFWELSRTIMAMFVEAPLMSMFVIGVPASVLSIVCYCICCLPNETLMDEELAMASRPTKDDDDDDGSSEDETDEPKTMSEKKEE